MRPVINLRHLEENSLRLKDELSPAEMDVDTMDELIHIDRPLYYDLEAQRMEGGVLVQGSLKLTLDCQCARCLKDFGYALKLPNWVCHLALTGDEPAKVVNDCVDLTPYVRDDIVLAFPQRPLCDPECKGLVSIVKKSSKTAKTDEASTPWAELNKLKL